MLQLQPPVIAAPITDWVQTENDLYYSSSLTQQILGSIPVPLDLPSNVLLTVAYTYAITRNNITTSFPTPTMSGIVAGTTNPALEDVPWSFDTEGYISLQEGDILTLNFQSREYVNQSGELGPFLVQTSLTSSTLIANIISINEVKTSASIPSGILLKMFKSEMKILVPKSNLIVSDNSDFLGCNFYISLSPGGGSSGYQLMNDTYINTTDDSELVETTITTSDAVSEAGTATIETKQTKTVATEFYTFSVDKTVLKGLVNDGKISNVFLADNNTINEDIIFYYVTTSVAYDKVLNTAVESFFSLELEGKFLKYTTTFDGLPTRTRQDILLSIVQRLTTNNSIVNVVTGQVIRDIIDPVTDMFAKFYVIEDFIFRCNSIDSLLYFDDTNGDGISDPVATSPFKTNLADALGITDFTILQSLIDQQFDKQAANFDLSRKAATTSQGKWGCSMMNND